MPAVLIQLNFEFVKDWIDRKHKKIGKTVEEIISSDVIKERIQEEIDKCNKNFGKWEQMKKFELTPDIWSIQGGHLTPTMKMKRNVIKDMYKDLFENIYRP